MLERSFTGFAALPPAKKDEKWWVVLGVREQSSKDEIKSAWVRLAKEHHPDRGGSNEMMSKINKAYAEGMNE